MLLHVLWFFIHLHVHVVSFFPWQYMYTFVPLCESKCSGIFCSTRIVDALTTPLGFHILRSIVCSLADCFLAVDVYILQVCRRLLTVPWST